MFQVNRLADSETASYKKNDSFGFVFPISTNTKSISEKVQIYKIYKKIPWRAF